MPNKIKLSDRTRSFVVLLLTLAALPLLSQNTAYAAGDGLDTSFGTGGIETTTIGNGANIFSVAINSSGQIIAGGYSNPVSSNGFALARYDATGSLDTSFGSDGIQNTTIGTWGSAYSIAIDPLTRKIIAGGASHRTAFTVARYNENGTLDTTFGTNLTGIETTTVGTDAYIQSVAIDGSGKIVVGGYARIASRARFALARYNANGSIDTSFNESSPGSNDGGVETTTIGNNSYLSSIAIDSSGRIVAGGHSNSGTGYIFTLARYNETGTLDTTFGTNLNGIETTTIGNSSYIQSIAIDSSGRIVAGGYSNNGSGEVFTLARFSSNGTLDTSFGTGGVETTTVSDYGSNINSIAIDSSERIIAGGYSWDSNYASQFALARYGSNGALDTTFGVGGIITSVISNGGVSTSYNDAIYSIALDSSDNIVAGGWSRNGVDPYTFALARYLNPADPSNEITPAPSTKTAAQLALEARAARDLVVANATREIQVSLISGKPLTVGLLASADIFGASPKNIGEINKEVALLPASSHQNLNELTKIINKFAIVAKIADRQGYYISDLVNAGFVASDSEFKTSIMLQLRSLPTDQIDSPEKINAVVAAVTKKANDRKAAIAAAIARIQALTRR